jgi:hypothetical protein
VATAVAVGMLIYQAYQAAGSLNDRELSLRAAALADVCGRSQWHGPRELQRAMLISLPYAAPRTIVGGIAGTGSNCEDA